MDEKVKAYLSELGTKGGSQTLKRHGKEHYKKIAKKRWELSTLHKQTESIELKKGRDNQ